MNKIEEKEIVYYKLGRLENLAKTIKVIIEEEICPFKKINKAYYTTCEDFCIDKKECRIYKDSLNKAYIGIINARNSLYRVIGKM
jgi:hypothetical protein